MRRETRKVVQRLRRRRLDLGLTVGEVASRIGRSNSLVLSTEHEQRTPTLDELYSWAEALDIPIAVLLRYKDIRLK